MNPSRDKERRNDSRPASIAGAGKALGVFLISLLGASHAHAWQKTGKVVRCTLESEALADNTLDLPGFGSLEVYLPPSYETDSSRRYPVLYLLHGIGGTSHDWTEQGPTIQRVMDELVEQGRIGEFLVVMPTARTPFGGSFYVNSPVNGRWDDFFAGDLVPFIDGEFRTRAERESRAIAGHSMGGYGALRLTMEHPELFADVLALSPACLDVSDDLGPSNPTWARMSEYRDMPALVDQVRNGNVYPMSLLAVAAAFSPDVGASPFPVKLPYRVTKAGVEPVEDVLALWKRFAIAPAARTRPGAFKNLRLLYLDYGYRDEYPHIPSGVEALHGVLASQAIPHVLEAYAGTHNDVLWKRLSERVLPLLGATLAPGR